MILDFPASGGDKIVKFSYDCDVSDLTFSPSEQWVDAINKTSTSITISVREREDTSSEDRTATVTVKIKGTETCSGDKKSLTIVQAGGDVICDLAIYTPNTKYLEWEDVTDTSTVKELTLSVQNGHTIQVIDANTTDEEHFNIVSIQNNIISIRPNGTVDVYAYATLNIQFKIDDSTNCTGYATLLRGRKTNRAAVAWEDNTQLLPQGEVRRRAATFTSDDPLFDVNELSINTPDWIIAEVEETAPGTGYVYLTYGYTPVSRMATIGATYRRAQAEGEDGGQTDVNQNGELYQDGLYFKITNSTLEPCGGSEYKIGEYCFDVLKPKDKPSDPDEYYFNYVENTSFTCTTKPDWVSSVTFGLPDVNNRKGDIYATYSKNPNQSERTWAGITITYSGYQNVKPVGNTTIKQEVVDTLGACGETVNPGNPPSDCTEANFYHWDNPYVPGDLSYYYLEHNISAYEQEYTLRTAADFNEYVTRTYLNGTTSTLPVSTIANDVWKDVRVEIYDVVPDIVHNSACGLHHVEVQHGDSFATIKKRHTSGNSQSTCACPCYFNGWNPNNGAYEIYGTKETALIAVYENGSLKTSETDEEAYSNFWLKATDCSHTYSSANGWRELNFTVERNTFDGAFDRCAMIKVYPKINGEYCTADCQDCERTARCQNERNCCLTDMVVQESVNCADTNEYFDPNHAYFNTYITSDYNQPVNSMLYEYWWGPCNDCWNGGTLAEDCDSTTTPYINAVDIYDATMIDKCGESSTQTDTCHDNIYGDYKIGDYLGTIYADGIYDGTDRRFQFPGDDCIRFDEDEHITGITIESKYDSDNGQYRGHIQLIAAPYAPSGKIYKYGDPNRYRVRILVPYHKGVNYSTGNSGCFFTKDEKFWLYYGPDSINHPSGGTYEWKGLTNGEFCVLRQDGLQES